MDPFDTAMTIIVTTMASSGFWAYIMKRQSNRSATTRLLMGLAHDRIIFLGMTYITRGWITKDEYEDFDKYLWEPYSEFGGNGLAEKVHTEVSNLQIVAGFPFVKQTEVPVTVVTTEET